MTLPKLGAVPSSFDHPLEIKATQTGIIIRPDTREPVPSGKKPLLKKYRKRYFGSQTCAVDINGKLHLSAKDLEALIKHEKELKEGHKKKALTRRPLLLNDSNEKTQISEDSAETPKKKRKRSYKIHKSRVRQRLLAFLNTGKGKKELYFFTVSFPEHTPDDVAYQALNTWLTSLRKRRKRKTGQGTYPPMLKDYLWVAERQDGKRAPGKEPTNTVHFHIAVPHTMNVHKANAMMRGTLKNLAREGKMPYRPFDRQIKKYNGVDLCKNKKTGRVVNFAIQKGARALAHYLSKYVTKNDADFTHLAWHNSRGYSRLFLAVSFTVKEFEAFGFKPFLFSARVFKLQFAEFIPWRMGPPPLLTDHLYQINTYIQNLLDGNDTRQVAQS